MGSFNLSDRKGQKIAETPFAKQLKASAIAEPLITVLMKDRPLNPSSTSNLSRPKSIPPPPSTVPPSNKGSFSNLAVVAAEEVSSTVVEAPSTPLAMVKEAHLQNTASSKETSSPVSADIVKEMVEDERKPRADTPITSRLSYLIMIETSFETKPAQEEKKARQRYRSTDVDNSLYS